MYIYLLYGDDNSGLIIGAIVGVIVWLVIIYNIISGATRSKKIEAHLLFQSMMLKEMALKNGVSEEQITASIKKTTEINYEVGQKL